MLNPIKASILLSRMKINQWKERDEIEQMQQDLLDKMLRHAKDKVPMYKGIDGRRLPDFPVITKEDVTLNGNKMLNKDCARGKLTIIRSSGSTGNPTNAYYDAEDGIYASVLRYHQLTECGFRPQDHLAEIMYNKEPKNMLQKVGLFRISHMSPVEPMGLLFRRLIDSRPDFILAYPSVLALLAKKNDVVEDRLNFKGTFCQSEVLRPSVRKTIEDSFSADVRNSYSAIETRNIAWECERGSMHINSDSIIVEVLDNKGEPVREGCSGHLVLTPLWRFSMPFIRYRIGDLGSVGGKCKCGRGTHILRSLEGRDNDIIFDASGEGVLSTMIEKAIEAQKEIVQFQVQQREKGEIHILAITSPGETGGKELAARVESMLKGISVTLEIVDSIQRTDRGKLKCISSELNRQQD